MSNEQITQETVPVEKTQPSTETVKPLSQGQVNAERQQQQAQQQEQMQMQQLQQVAKAGGDIAPLAKALPEEAKAVANADIE